MGYSETDIGSDLKEVFGQPYELMGFGIENHPDGLGQLHIGQRSPATPSADLNAVAEAAYTGGIPAMLAEASARSASLRAWMDAVAANPRAVALGGLFAVEDRMKLRHVYGR